MTRNSLAALLAVAFVFGLLVDYVVSYDSHATVLCDLPAPIGVNLLVHSCDR
jgi:hypothetical protein